MTCPEGSYLMNDNPPHVSVELETQFEATPAECRLMSGSARQTHPKHERPKQTFETLKSTLNPKPETHKRGLQ